MPLTYQSLNSIIRAILINSIIAYGTQRIIVFNQEFGLKSYNYQILSNLFNINMVKSSILYHKSIASISFENSIDSSSKHTVLSEALHHLAYFLFKMVDRIQVRYSYISSIPFISQSSMHIEEHRSEFTQQKNSLVSRNGSSAKHRRNSNFLECIFKISSIVSFYIRMFLSMLLLTISFSSPPR